MLCKPMWPSESCFQLRQLSASEMFIYYFGVAHYFQPIMFEKTCSDQLPLGR